MKVSFMTYPGSAGFTQAYIDQTVGNFEEQARGLNYSVDVIKDKDLVASTIERLFEKHDSDVLIFNSAGTINSPDYVNKALNATYKHTAFGCAPVKYVSDGNLWTKVKINFASRVRNMWASVGYLHEDGFILNFDRRPQLKDSYNRFENFSEDCLKLRFGYKYLESELHIKPSPRK